MLTKFFYFLFYITRANASGELKLVSKVQNGIALMNTIFFLPLLILADKNELVSLSRWDGYLIITVLFVVNYAMTYFLYIRQEEKLREYMETFSKTISKAQAQGFMLLYFILPFLLVFLAAVL